MTTRVTETSDADVLAKMEIIIHTPAGSGPEAMANALIEAGSQVGADTSGWVTRFCTEDHGVAAMRALVERSGDASVVSTCTPSFVQTPLLEGLEISFRDLTPLACLMLQPYLLLVRADDPIESGEEFLASVGGRATTTGGYMQGGINHLAGLAVADATGATVEFKQVPSASDLLPALLAGELDWAIATEIEARDALARGEVRALALLAAARSDGFPDLETLGEVGVPLSLSVWRGLMAPPDIPASSVEKWRETLAEIVKTPRWAEFLGSTTPTLITGADFAALLEEQDAWYAEQFRRAGLVG